MAESEEGSVRFRRRRSNEPYFDFSWKVSREESAAGPVVVLELVNREDDDDATRLGCRLLTLRASAQC